MPTLDFITYFSSLLPILVFLPFLLKKKELPVWVIFFYSLYSFSNDTIIIYRSDHHLRFSIFLYIFTIIEYLLFAFILFKVIINKKVKQIIILASVLFTAFCLFNILGKHIHQFDSVQASIESILIIAYCITYFYEQINQPQVTFIYADYKFWIVIACLIYLAGSFFLYVYAAAIPTAMRKEYWVINLFCNIIKNILFAIAIIIHVKAPKSTKIQSLKDYQPFLNEL